MARFTRRSMVRVGMASLGIGLLGRWSVPRHAQAEEYVGSRSIVVSISNQWLYAYEDGVLMFDSGVSTGRDGFDTPIGDFAVYAKLDSQTMSGNIGGEDYYVPDVPYVQYIYEGVALHGTYWHNDFGNGIRHSHGCVNLPLDAAEWLYYWTDIGTPVSVIE